MLWVQTSSDNKSSIRKPAWNCNSIDLFGCEHQRKDDDSYFIAVAIRCQVIGFSRSSIAKAAPYSWGSGYSVTGKTTWMETKNWIRHICWPADPLRRTASGRKTLRALHVSTHCSLPQQVTAQQGDRYRTFSESFWQIYSIGTRWLYAPGRCSRCWASSEDRLWVSSHRIYLEKRGKQNNRHKVNKSIDQKIVGETAGAGNDCNFKWVVSVVDM